MHGRRDLFGFSLLLPEGFLRLESDFTAFHGKQSHFIRRVFKSGQNCVQMRLLSFDSNLDPAQGQFVIGVAFCSKVIGETVFK